MLQVRSIIGTTKSEPVKKKSLPAKKPSLIEMAREEDPFLGKHLCVGFFHHPCPTLIFILLFYERNFFLQVVRNYTTGNYEYAYEIVSTLPCLINDRQCEMGDRVFILLIYE